MRIKPAWTKRRTICKKCGLVLDAGSVIVKIWFRYGTHWYPKTYCLDCFIGFLNKWWKENEFEPETRVPSARKKSTLSLLRRRYLSLLIYHRKRGNKRRVKELEEQIRRLEEI